MNDHIIRPVTSEDAEAVTAIYRHHVLHGTATFDTDPPGIDEMREKIDWILAKGLPFLVIERDSTVVGYAYATPFRDRKAYAATCENSIYVHPEYVGKGAGTALLAALLDAAEVAGFRQMIAVIGGGEPASVALHSRAGFEHAGRMKSVGRKFDLWLDTVYMQRAIGLGDAVPPEVRLL
jgi:L-amino acid N-acyltransferase YncA